jgi:quercetin dioxygenase-like cupin family protein
MASRNGPFEWSVPALCSSPSEENVVGYRKPIIVGMIAAAAAAWIGRLAAQSRPSQARTVFAGKLPALDGQHLQSTVVEVTYPPGGANATHRHPCPVIGYVLEGSLRMQVRGQPERVYTPGDTFFEAPTDVHVVSANASADVPARFLAYFVCDRETPLSVPVTGAKPQ